MQNTTLQASMFDATPLRAILLACAVMPVTLTGHLLGQTAPPAAATPATSRPKQAAPSTSASSATAKELREAQLIKDTERLYQLAQELKEEVDKSTKDTLSITALKKAAEVEKLAHSLKDRLKSE